MLAMTATWHTAGPGTELTGRVEAACSPITNCGLWSRQKLELEWSPEQIATWLRQTFPDQPSKHVCHETIYQALYCGGHAGLRRQLTQQLRTGRPLRKRRRRPQERSPRFISPGQLIDQRPSIVADRVRVGDWEGDLIVGRHSRSAIGTLVDRASRYVTLVHLPGNHRRNRTRRTHVHIGQSPGPEVRRTLTWDQGSKMAFCRCG
ncbi:IS30 family transposase [Dactylosporangium sp. CS-047395]|uniref:IS30 family transposase n=1 Tax=Dactylosporangium sp. CS-047395 TaxID=3239936 RepID=UPI003D9237A3